MNRLRTLITLVTVALALVAIALWPTYVDHSTQAARASSLPTMAPVTKDYLLRPKLVAFWESTVHKHHRDDFLSPRQLSGQYLQRYRENGDIDDVLRSIAMANLSLKEMPRGNVAARMELASADLTLHKFKEALAVTKQVELFVPADNEMRIREASLDLELGDYANARRIIAALPPAQRFDVTRDTLLVRWHELTGHLRTARLDMERPTALANSQFDAPAQSRAWFFFRSGELAFEAGDNDGAIAFEKKALEVFPHFADAYRAEARFECAIKAWQACLASAKASADIVPYPETLGYVEDAQRALGDEASANATAATILAVEKIGDSQHISDRLLAIYFSEHRIHTDDAYRIARRELAIRDDIFTEDTLAWAAAMNGRWSEARIAIRKATRLGTENSLLLYHAGIVADHFGDRASAKADFTKALALNANFHQTYADDARARLAKL